jgi:hypothetical protein
MDALCFVPPPGVAFSYVRWHPWGYPAAEFFLEYPEIVHLHADGTSSRDRTYFNDKGLPQAVADLYQHVHASGDPLHLGYTGLEGEEMTAHFLSANKGITDWGENLMTRLRGEIRRKMWAGEQAPIANEASLLPSEGAVPVHSPVVRLMGMIWGVGRAELRRRGH